MKQSSRCWRTARRRGLTLVEVVAASTLLASLMVGTLLAFTAHRKQIRTADERLHAVRLADELLQTWSGKIPRNTTGLIRLESDRWLWRTTSLRRQSLADTAFDIVRLEVFPPKRGAVGGRPVIVDLVVRPPQ